MNAAATLQAVKADLQGVNDQIDAATVALAALRAQKRQLVADRDDLQAFLDFKAAQP